jgi:cell division protein FtsB
MANGALGANQTEHVNRRARARSVVRLAGRITVLALGLLISTLVGVQFARVADENFTLARQLSSVRTQIADLEKRRTEQRRELQRLRDPEGVVPEIHDRLRMTRPNEEIIFVRPVPSPTP